MPTSIYEINRKYQLNDAYFQTIDTEEKAYWLGFIWADGSIEQTSSRCSGKNRFVLTQKINNLNHLKKFQKAIQNNNPITTKQPMLNKTIAILTINSRPFCKRLEELGFDTKDKRIVPTIPKHLINHFIRGFFDGDGCLSIYDQKIKKWTVHRQEWSITGPKQLIQQIQKLINDNINVSTNVQLKYYKRTANAVSLRYGKKLDIDTLYKFMYQNATIYLGEKHQKFIDFYSQHQSI